LTEWNTDWKTIGVNYRGGLGWTSRYSVLRTL